MRSKKPKPSLVFLIRGFVDRKNWVPLSRRRYQKGHEIANLNFLKVSDGYFRLQEQLKKKYKVSTVVSTYDTSRPSQLSEIKKKLKAEIFLSPEKGSYQFTTVVNYLESLKRFTADYLVVVRSDLWLSPYAIDEIADLSPVSNTIYSLYFPTNPNSIGQTPDCFHFIPSSCVPFYLAFSKHVKKMQSSVKPGGPHIHHIAHALKWPDLCLLSNGVIDVDAVIREEHWLWNRFNRPIPTHLNFNYHLFKHSVCPPYTEEELELYAEWRKIKIKPDLF